jgi:hypothetical protein
MIGGLFIALGILLFCLWLSVMFLWWQKERNTNEPLATDVALTYADKGQRLLRRGWYFSQRHLKEWALWGSKKVSKVFFSLFPNAAPAFAKRDELAGLKQGPSSFFLLSLSEKEKQGAGKRTVSRKRIV